jgi:beta-galactosidase/beta-glucuronidase
MVSETNRIWYRRTFTIPRGWKDKKVLLHFGAVDWESTVFVNGKKIGAHQGGYDAFSFDITDALDRKGKNEIVVSVWDPTDAGPQSRGKQIRNPHGIWYTPTSGIWQTVWLEPVEATHVKKIKITPDVDTKMVTVEVIIASEKPKFSVNVEARYKGSKVAEASQNISFTKSGIAIATFKLPVAPRNRKGETTPIHLWSPENPALYDLNISLSRSGKKVDELKSYFGMRKISLARDDKGRLRMQLNNTNYFQFGLLDQGFWPEGIYTAPTDEALRYDIEMTKKFGFNMAPGSSRCSRSGSLRSPDP